MSAARRAAWFKAAAILRRDAPDWPEMLEAVEIERLAGKDVLPRAMLAAAVKHDELPGEYIPGGYRSYKLEGGCEFDTVGFFQETSARVRAGDLAEWLVRAGIELPSDCLLNWWLGDAAKVGADKTAERKGGRPKGAHKEALTRIVEALENFARAAGEPFDRWNMPGPRGEGPGDRDSFHWLCAKLEPKLFTRSAATFERHREGVCAFAAWAKRSDFYRRALPHIASKFADEGRTPTRQKTA